MEPIPAGTDQRQQVGAALRRVREARRWSRRRLAEEAGVPEPTIRDIETGATPNHGTLDKLLDALDVEITTFGLMSPWMADQIAALIVLAQQVPRDRLPETIGALMTVLGKAARGIDISDLGMNPNISQIVVTAEADVDQNIT